MDDDVKKSPQLAGGIARAAALTPERRREIAQQGGAARWKQEIQRDTHEGTLAIGGISFACSVLEDGTRILSETAFMKGMGIYRSGALSTRRRTDVSAQNHAGAQTPLFLAQKNLKPFVIQHLGPEHKVGIKYLTKRGKGPVAHGIPAETIPKICEVWIDAKAAGVLGESQLRVAEKADLILRALARVGIIALVDEATGYQGVRPKDALQQYLEMILRKDLAAWSKRFPDEFYENIYKLKGWPWPGMKKNRYSVVAHYTRDLVYERLAPGLLKELEAKTPRNANGSRPNKLHQYFTEDVGHPLLAQHLHSLIMFQRLAISNGHGWLRFVKTVNQVMPKKGQNLELHLMQDPEVAPAKL
jgi:hypothetical protein